jgi:phage gp29-like protein
VTAHIEAGQKKPTTRNQAIADFVGHVLDNTGYFPQHLYNLMGALGMGFSASEIIWDVTGDGVVVKDILNRPQRRFQFDAVTREPKIRDITNPYFGTPLPANKFIVHRCGSTWQNPFGDALDQSLYWMWLFKKTALKFWIQYLQTGASSIPIVKHPASANDKLKDEALAIAQLIRNGAYGRIPENFEIIWAEASNVSQSVDAYEAFVRQCNDEMSKCVNGQTLTAEASGTDGSGSRALGEVHELTQNARDLFRARALESTLNVTIIKWIVDFNFSSVDGYPKFRFDVEQSEDLNQEADIVQKLSAAGYNFDEKELSEKFNYTITKKEALNLVPSKEVGKEEGEEEKENNEKENLKENEK